MTARVLVVDDILANVRLLEAKLTAEYFEVHTTQNGIEALELVQRVKPDIVLLDVMMPGMDGIEVCRRIKSNSQTQHIPVIMITAMDQPDDRVRGTRGGSRRFPHQTGERRGIVLPGEEPGAAQDAHRRTALAPRCKRIHGAGESHRTGCADRAAGKDPFDRQPQQSDQPDQGHDRPAARNQDARRSAACALRGHRERL